MFIQYPLKDLLHVRNLLQTTFFVLKVIESDSLQASQTEIFLLVSDAFHQIFSTDRTRERGDYFADLVSP